jgi:hypothetical protein
MIAIIAAASGTIGCGKKDDKGAAKKEEAKKEEAKKEEAKKEEAKKS